MIACLYCILILPINTAIESQENIHGRVNNCDNRECFPPLKILRFSLICSTFFVSQEVSD